MSKVSYLESIVSFDCCFSLEKCFWKFDKHFLWHDIQARKDENKTWSLCLLSRFFLALFSLFSLNFLVLIFYASFCFYSVKYHSRREIIISIVSNRTLPIVSNWIQWQKKRKWVIFTFEKLTNKFHQIDDCNTYFCMFVYEFFIEFYRCKGTSRLFCIFFFA